MNLKLQKKLYKKYPKIFIQKNLTIQESCMPCGINCDDGWYKIIDELCSAIQKYIDKNNVRQVEAVQVKEKFGLLCFYTNYGDEKIWKIINSSEEKSDNTCELCGSTKEIGKTEGYILTLCRKCAEKNKKTIWFPKKEIK